MNDERAGSVKLTTPQPNYLERATADPAQELERAKVTVRADRKRRAHYLINGR